MASVLGPVCSRLEMTAADLQGTPFAALFSLVLVDLCGPTS
jgi:hypothetical protein